MGMCMYAIENTCTYRLDAESNGLHCIHWTKCVTYLEYSPVLPHSLDSRHSTAELTV